MTIYNYKKESDSEDNKYPVLTHSIVETSSGYLYMVLNSDDTKIDKSTDAGANWTNITDENYSIVGLYYDRTNERIYFFYAWGADSGALKYIDLSDDSINTVFNGGPLLGLGTDLTLYDIVQESDNDLHIFGTNVEHPGDWRWGIVHIDFDFTIIENGLAGDPSSDISMSYTINIDDDAYMLVQLTTDHVELWKEDLGLGGALLVEDIGANLNLPDSKNLRGISYDGSDILYFILKDTTDSKNYLYVHSISGGSSTKKGEYNISLMLDRNTNSANQVGFNLEKGFHLTSRYVYQIARTKGSLYQIADLTNVLYEADDSAIDGTIVAITDTYLFLKRTSNDIEIWKFQDFSDHYFIFDIMMYERDYPTAYCEYDSRYLGLGQGTFVQCIGNVRVKGSTSVDVKFEGYCLKPEQLDEEAKYLMAVDLVSPAYFDLIKGIDGSYTGDSDGNIDTLDDRFNYVTKGTYDDGAALEPLTTESEKKVYTFLDELAIGNSGTWGIRPKGVLDFVLAADDSGIDYDQSTPIWNVIISKRIVQYNEVTLKGAYVNGTLVQSDTQVNQANQDQRGPIPFDLTIAWLQTTANANTWATAILAMLSTEYTEVEFSVYDATNGFIPPTEQITLADSNKGITSAQYWINSLIHHDKTNITDYVCSSAVRWDDDDLKDKLPEDLSDQVGQVAGTVVTNEDTMESYLAIGSANARYKNLSSDGGSDFSYFGRTITHFNKGADNMILSYPIDIPFTLGSLSLYVSEIVLGIRLSDANDYVDRVRLIYWTDEDSYTDPIDIDHDTVSGTAKGTFTYDSNDDGNLPIDLSSVKAALLYIEGVNDGATDLQISFVRVKYYYA